MVDDSRSRIELTDARQMRAMAHPTRLALIGLLRSEGPLTATEAGARLGESSGSMSFHLRQLAKYGLVEETGDGAGRRKPWRATAQATAWSNAPDEPELALATAQLTRVLAQRYAASLLEWLDRRPFAAREWQVAGEVGDSFVWLTADELTALSEQVQRLLAPFHDRISDPAVRPDDARRVLWLHLAFPQDQP